MRKAIPNSDSFGFEDPSNITYDFIYPMSENELKAYVARYPAGVEQSVRSAYATDFTIVSGVNVCFENSRAEYWLRDSFFNQARIVDVDGDVQSVDSKRGMAGIRVCANLDIDEFVKLGIPIASRPDWYSGQKRLISLGQYPQSTVGYKGHFHKDLQVKSGQLQYERFIPTLRCLSGSPTKYYDRRIYEKTSNHEKFVCAISQNTSRNDLSDGQKCPKMGKSCWLKMEPITWEIVNWDKLPKDINPDGDGTAKSIEILTTNVLDCFPFSTEETDNVTWQNSDMRAFLNGYNVHDEVLLCGNGNKNNVRSDDSEGSFLGNSFFNVAFGFSPPSLSNSKIVGGKSIDVASIQSQEPTEINKKERRGQMRLDRLNPDTSKPIRRVRLTDSEMIKEWIDNGESVLLRGPSGIGKTERIKSMYPDLIFLKLTNNMFPEKVVGSFNFQTGQEIPPNFAKTALLACATDEERKMVSDNIQNIYAIADDIYERSQASDDKIVILLDELLNVKPSVQSLVYTLVLNKFVEQGKGVKLPKNVVVVATGNQRKYSSVAEDLVEPLEKRFDHILDMEPKVGEWLYEYAIPHNVHPSVIGYIMAKYNEASRSESIARMGYFYEEPEVGEKNLDKNGCRGRTNDPRGWVSVSTSLKNFENNLKAGKYIGKDVEHLLKTTLGTKLREEWANEFFDFYNRPTPTIEDVMSDDVMTEDLPNNISDRFACVTSMLGANMQEVGKVREFVRRACGSEYVSMFDLCWVGNDRKRKNKIYELIELSAKSNVSGEMENE